MNDYSPDEIREWMALRERRRTGLLSLLLVVLVLIGLVVYLIVSTPKDERERKPTEGEGEYLQDTLDEPVKFTPSEEAIEIIEGTVSDAMKYFEQYKYQMIIDEANMRIVQQQEEIDGLYLFIDRLTEFIGAIYVREN